MGSLPRLQPGTAPHTLQIPPRGGHPVLRRASRTRRPVRHYPHFRIRCSPPEHRRPRVINTDQARLYGSAMAGVKKAGILRRRCRHRPVQYVNNIVEQDHRAIKRRVTAKQGFRAFHAARRTIQGYEAMHMIRKGLARWVSGSDGRRQIQFINKLSSGMLVEYVLVTPNVGTLARFRCA